MKKIPAEYNPYDVNGISENGALETDVQLAQVIDGKVVLRRLSDVLSQ
ncbi:MAG: hypothetical protein RLN92_05995 [Alloalcanivorax xenomutans]